LKPAYKEGVSFAYHNLVTQPFPSLVNDLFAFDLILCRNVTIYFSYDIVRGILDHFRQCLVDGGWLLVGHAEPNVDLFRAFRTVNAPAGAVLYQKAPEHLGTPAPAAPAPPVPSSPWAPAFPRTLGPDPSPRRPAGAGAPSRSGE